MSDKFTRWDEPATVGELLTSMIWTQALVTGAMGVIVTLVSSAHDSAKTREAYDKYLTEWNDFTRKVNQLGGKISDGE